MQNLNQAEDVLKEKRYNRTSATEIEKQEQTNLKMIRIKLYNITVDQCSVKDNNTLI